MSSGAGLTVSQPPAQAQLNAELRPPGLSPGVTFSMSGTSCSFRQASVGETRLEANSPRGGASKVAICFTDEGEKRGEDDGK